MVTFDSSSKVVILTGAGVSAESGVRTFRDNDGLWEDHRVEDVATPHAWSNDPYLVWRFYQERRRQLLSVDPNPSHFAIAQFEQYLERGLLSSHKMWTIYMKGLVQKTLSICMENWQNFAVKCAICRGLSRTGTLRARIHSLLRMWS